MNNPVLKNYDERLHRPDIKLTFAEALRVSGLNEEKSIREQVYETYKLGGK